MKARSATASMMFATTKDVLPVHHHPISCEKKHNAKVRNLQPLSFRICKHLLLWKKR